MKLRKFNSRDLKKFEPIKYSKIYHDIHNLNILKRDLSNLININEKKIKKNKATNQRSFYFEDYLKQIKIKKFKNIIIMKIEIIYYSFSFFL